VTWHGALRWWRRAALLGVAVASAVLVCQRGCLDGRAVAGDRFELLPVSPDAVSRDWSGFQVIAEVQRSGGEAPMLRLGPLGVEVYEGRFPRGQLLRTLRLCNASNCDESAVVLLADDDSREQRVIPEGTWRLRRDDARGQWLVSYAGGDPIGPEKLAAAVLRSAVPLSVRRPPDAVYCVFGAALCALASILWGVWRAARRGERGGADEVLTAAISAAISAFVLASVIVVAFWSPPMVAPAWDLRALPESARPTDWRAWPLVDVARSPMDPRGPLAQLGPFDLETAEAMDPSLLPASILRQRGVRTDVCSLDSCARADPRGWSQAGSADALDVYGLRHRPDSNAWVATYAEGDVEREVGVPWARVQHKEGLPWICMAIAMACFLFDLAFLNRLERGGHPFGGDAIAEVPWFLQSTSLSRALTTVAVGCSLAGPEFLAALNDSARYDSTMFVGGLSAAVLGMAGAAVLREESGPAGAFWRRWLWLLPLVLLHATAVSLASIVAGRSPAWNDVSGAAQTAVAPRAWLPPLLYALLFYAIPMVWSRRLAKGGLSGAERGDQIVGAAAIATSLVPFVVPSLIRGACTMVGFEGWVGCAVKLQPTSGIAFVRSLAVVGLLAGAAAVVVARVRASKRRAFMERAEAGQVPGYRVEERAQGKVLLRTVEKEETYRAGPEEICVAFDKPARPGRA
jgi:hypothetical protein